jgi:small neutral amino acid transporter SnatA (MarC family)
MWSDLDSVDKALVVIGLSWSFFTAILPGKSERSDDTLFMKGITAVARVMGILLTAVMIMAVRHRFWK